MCLESTATMAFIIREIGNSVCSGAPLTMTFSQVLDLVKVFAVNNAKLLYNNLCCIKRPRVVRKCRDIVVGKGFQRVVKNGVFWMVPVG